VIPVKPGMMNRQHFTIAVLVAGLAATTSARQSATTYDLVIAGGRVIDPESGLDEIRDVGIAGDRIAAIAASPLQGRDRLDARGLVVSPGFIDLHRHAVGDNSYRYAARDGVTSTFELEIGTPDVDAWYRMMGPARLVNFGVSAGHIGARMAVMGDKGFLLPTGPARGPATPAQQTEILRQVAEGLDAGGLAVGMGIAYTPGVSPEEIEGVLRLAAAHHTFLFVHMGGGGVASLTRLTDLAASLGAPVHVAHVNSTAGSQIQTWLEAIRAARGRGADVTTEVYPYTAGATLIQSALYDNWESWPDERFARMQWAATGEWLTRESFAKYRAIGGSVISHANTEDALRIGIADPLPMFSSDGGRDFDDNPTHPRASGTFARILGRYVREARLLTLGDALRRMTLEPARRLEARVPEMHDRGRLRVGAYADITVFDPETVIDKSTYADAAEYSVGIQDVVVNGVPVVRDGDLVTRGELQGQHILIGSPVPGRPIRAAVVR
jgi:N-acyl-D-aspartate/D-glutamate deacylase